MNHLICFGNELHGDDGFGAVVYQRLLALGAPPGWLLFETGSRGLDALALFDGCEQAIIVDAAAPAGCPGRLIQPKAADIETSAAVDVHGAGVGYLLRALAVLDRRPQLRVIAAEMTELTSFQPGLSPAVEQAVERVIPILRRWMERSGAE